MSQTSIVLSFPTLYFSIPRGWICDDQAYGLMRRFYLWVFLAALLHGGFFLLPVVEQFGQTVPSQALTAVNPQSRTTLIRIEAKRGTDHIAQTQVVETPLPVESEIREVSEFKAAQPSVTPPVPKRSVPKVAVEKKRQPIAKPETPKPLMRQENVARQMDKPLPKIQGAESAQSARVLDAGQRINNLASAEGGEAAEVNDRVHRIMAKPISTRKPKYPRRAIVRNQQGSVSVELVISEEGLVERAELLKSSGYELLDRSVMKFVDKERFLAALEEGEPIASTQLFTFRFVLN